MTVDEAESRQPGALPLMSINGARAWERRDQVTSKSADASQKKCWNDDSFSRMGAGNEEDGGETVEQKIGMDWKKSN